MVGSHAKGRRNAGKAWEENKKGRGSSRRPRGRRTGTGGTSPRNPQECILNKSMATTTAPAQAASSSAPAPILATGDWTKNLVHLAKTAELKSVSPRYPSSPRRRANSRLVSLHAHSKPSYSPPARLPAPPFHTAPHSPNHVTSLRRRVVFVVLFSISTIRRGVKETCANITAPHRAYPLRACRARTEEQSYPGSQGAEEQVRLPPSLTPCVRPSHPTALFALTPPKNPF